MQRRSNASMSAAEVFAARRVDTFNNRAMLDPDWDELSFNRVDPVDIIATLDIEDEAQIREAGHVW